MIEALCALKKIKTLKNNSQDIIYGDFPYALGSQVYIDKKDGKPKFKNAKDFQNKWNMPDHVFWEEFFNECFRVLKHGGRVLAFGIDRQLMLFNYYAVAAGLEIQQSLYWYFIQNFPKAIDLSKQIDKKQGNIRESIGTVERYAGSEKNNHPTLKPILLNKKIALLLKTPHKQKVFFPFAGTASEIIGFEQAGYDATLFTATEINKSSTEIGNKRIKFWRNYKIEKLPQIKVNKKSLNEMNLFTFQTGA